MGDEARKNNASRVLLNNECLAGFVVKRRSALFQTVLPALLCRSFINESEPAPL